MNNLIVKAGLFIAFIAGVMGASTNILQEQLDVVQLIISSTLIVASLAVTVVLHKKGAI